MLLLCGESPGLQMRALAASADPGPLGRHLSFNQSEEFERLNRPSGPKCIPHSVLSGI